MNLYSIYTLVNGIIESQDQYFIAPNEATALMLFHAANPMVHPDDSSIGDASSKPCQVFITCMQLYTEIAP